MSDCAVTHVLVEFIDEKRLGVVPLHRIKEKEFQAGDQITIVWTDRKLYAATLILSGNYLLSNECAFSKYIICF